MTWTASFNAHIDSLKLSSSEVAKALKVPPSSVSYWRRGGSLPRAATLRKIERWSKGKVPASLARPQAA